MPSSRKLTIYDLASLAGTSASTVSAVLNGTWKKRRISKASAEAIQKIAEEAGYLHNMQARGLRKHRSGLIGMIIPLHDNRFFSSISQVFEREARARDFWPIVVSTLRDPEMEISTARTLMSYRIEYLLVTGATDPDGIGSVCDAAGVRHVNLDLPGRTAPSIISDNYQGAYDLANAVYDRIFAETGEKAPWVPFLGGRAQDHATARRIEGFSDAARDRGMPLYPEQIEARGYAPELAEATIRKLYETHGKLPSGLFINSTIAFEGVIRFFRTLPRNELHTLVVGCYDWDPFATLVDFPLIMVRQDVEKLVTGAFSLIDAGDFSAREPILVQPQLVTDLGGYDRRDA
ncbi:LacI family DNA-binding transcriptional regulator [Pelagibacterium lentulum]|uniref:LacI family transcriptional regulator n=1 Tax=Pelagibacterium lentulum TaxID=2029865 RepID=A0A916RM10_9HYPH|nr:LacI family DNA-binding transcriptional regulator [Pelagibacterium lentulum]GGA62366.1 LacI family transcriptional regulator [Pelagibacterium lentulum]